MLWSGLTTLVVLVVLGVVLYVAVERSLASSGLAQLDARMAVITGQPPDTDDLTPYGFSFGGPGSGTFSLILGPDGQPVGPGPDSRMPPGLPEASAVAAAASSGRDVRTTEIRGTPVRILTQTAQGRHGDIFTIQVIQDRTAEQRTLSVMLAVLLVGGLVVVLVAFGFGFVYARRALVPIRESLGNQRTALRRQRDFAADASHELRTPLTVIRSSVEHLSRHKAEPVGEVGTALEDIDDEVSHMTAIVEDLLLLARSDSGAIELEHLPVDLGDVAADGASALAKPASDRGVQVEVDPHPAVVTGDPARLRQLVMILVDNAIRHSPPTRPGHRDRPCRQRRGHADGRRPGARHPAVGHAPRVRALLPGARARRAAAQAWASRSRPGSWSATADGSRCPTGRRVARGSWSSSRPRARRRPRPPRP